LRGRVSSGVERVRLSWWSIGQSALAGAVAWEIAVRLLHHPAPFFAAVAGIVCLSISVLNRLRRVFEMAIGVSLGVGLGDLLVREIGRGGWQLGLVVLIAMTAALLLDGGVLIVNQAALQAVFVTALPPPSGGYVGRWLDALLGGLTALVIAFLLPADPRAAMRSDVARVVQGVADALHLSASAARDGDGEAAHAALEEARATEPALRAWNDSVRAAEEISRLSPLRRRAEAEIAAHRHSVQPMDRAVRNIRVALRRVVATVEDGEVVSPGLPDRLDELAGALWTVPGALLDADGEGGRRSRAALTGLAGGLNPEELGIGTMSATVIVAQLRSAVVDLLQIPGLNAQDARAVLRS
jgi:uncharacterized membrane protein YgaE (UPF0421/DUF939 family)